MPKRGDNIRKRNDGRWEGRYQIGRYDDGRIKYKSVYGRSYTDVKEKLKESIINSSKSNIKTLSITYSDVLKLWLSNNKINHKNATEYKYQYVIEKHIIPELGGYKMSQINSFIINQFLSEKLSSGRLVNGDKLSPAYVRIMMIIIKSSIDFAVAEELCQPLKSPINQIPLPKKEVNILSEDDYKKLKSFLMKDITPTKLGILISLYTGLRIGEICALSWEDIDLKENIIHVYHTVSRIKSDTQNMKT